MKKLVITLVVFASISTAIFAQSTSEENTPQSKETAVLEKIETEPQILRFYPNPVGDQLTISSAKVIDLIQIHNYAGELMVESKYIDYAIDITTLKKGKYILTAYSSGEVIREKIVRI